MKKRTREPAPPSTGDLINQLSQERLALYRRGAGHPMPREVRARLLEIVRELDRLWERRRQELASPPFAAALAEVQAAVASSAAGAGESPVAVPAHAAPRTRPAAGQKARPRSDREVA